LLELLDRTDLSHVHIILEGVVFHRVQVLIHVYWSTIDHQRNVGLGVLLLIRWKVRRESIVQHAPKSMILRIFVEECRVTLNQHSYFLLVLLVLSNDLRTHLLLRLLILLLLRLCSGPNLSLRVPLLGRLLTKE